MFHPKYQRVMCALALAGALGWGGFPVHADGRDDDRRDDDHDQRVKTVFVIAMENHNWVQPSGLTTSPEQIFTNPAAPFINSLVNGTSGISGQLAYATNYQNAAPGNHPSEPNYVWAEAGNPGNSLGTDADPYTSSCAVQTIVTTNQHLSAFLTKAKKTWKSYQEDANVNLTSNVPLASSSWTVPLFSHSGNFTTGLNEYNFSTQYNYAAKHNPMVFFTDTAGPCPATASIQYPPLQQLALDLQNNTVADYNWITPDQYNEQHSALSAGYGSFVPSSDQSAVAEGDNFVSRIVPLIMASDAYKDHGLIVLWWDESEGGDTSAYTLPFIIISKDAHENVGGKPYSNAIQYSHSSTLRTMQEIFDVDPWHGYSWLGDASNATDLSDLFKPDSIR